MEPLIGESVGLIDPGSWSIGTSMLCEQLQGQQPPPEDAVAHWNDGDSVFCLRPKLPTTSPSGDSAAGRFYDHFFRSAAWNLSPNVICKASGWIEGMETEGVTLEFVAKEFPSVPIPEVIHHWVDPSWNRCFIITRRVRGERLNDVWCRVSHEQRMDVAAQLAKHSVTMAEIGSVRCAKPTGVGICFEAELFSGVPEEVVEAWPSWKPVLHPVLTVEEFTARTIELRGTAPPDMGQYFMFAHMNMGPTNIFVLMPAEKTGRVELSAIIDWKSAGFYPHWYISTKPRISADFALDNEFRDEIPADGGHWMWILSDALMLEGFDLEVKWWMQNVIKRNNPDELEAIEKYQEQQKAWRGQATPEKQLAPEKQK